MLKGGMHVQINIQDRAKEELDKILKAKGVGNNSLRIHVAGVG
jgi:Fe-S cluster assembly iron-binding protein IscA